MVRKGLRFGYRTAPDVENGVFGGVCNMRYIRILTVLTLVGLPAFADVTFNTSYLSNNNAATAVFSATGGTLTITLTNNLTTIDDISEILDGFAFTLNGTGVTITPSSLAVLFPTSQANGNFVDCTTHQPSGTALNLCTETTTFKDGGGGGSTVTSPYTWGLSGSYLLAGGGTGFHPGGIVNKNVTQNSNNGNGGTKNDQHNDMLLGPVEFTLSYTGTITGVGSATFDWGTGPAATDGTCTTPGGCGGGGNIQGAVPEPTSIALLGGVLFFTFGALRRKFRN
jgi:hypothetical protein